MSDTNNPECKAPQPNSIIMANFLKIVFGSCLGVILATVAVFLIGGGIVGSLVSKADAPKSVESNSILKVAFDSPLPEKSNNVPVDPYSFDIDETLGLHDMVAAIEHAKTDDKIKGIFLDLTTTPSGQATAATLRKALSDFQSEGKFVLAYGKYFTQGSYYLASAADQILMNPLGVVDFRGFSTQIPFFKDMLDRLGVKMQVYYAGQFKSATEPFRRYNMSEQNRLQTREYLEGMYQIYLDDIAASRDIPVSKLRRVANDWSIRKAEDAIQYNFVDQLAYRDEVLDNLRERLGLEKKDKIKSISISDYHKGRKKGINFKIKDKIAIVYAEGEIVDGEGEPGSVGGDKYAGIIRKIREDEKIKAIVLRVNSPGGSGLASDIMWRELTLAREQGLPVIVSMGNYAASGGYYISCMADTIFAQPNTITGSIGVFGMLPSVQKMMDEKMGITFDSVKTGPYAHGLSPFFEVTEAEGKIIQNSVNEFYDIFVSKVAEGRNMTPGAVHEVAQGRVWTGAKALEIGLVDQLGDLQNAIQTAANKAGLEEYRLTEYPRTKDPIQRYVEKFTGQGDQAKLLLESELESYFPGFYYLKQFKEMKGVQARLPFFTFD